MDWLSTVAAVASAVASLGALGVAIIALWPARRAAVEAARQTELQRRAIDEAHQPYLWVDIQPNDASGRLLMIVVANEGPSVASNVRVTFTPPIPECGGNLDRSQIAQRRLREGLLSLAPGRKLMWPIGTAALRLDDPSGFDSTVTYRVDVDAEGPSGPILRSTADIRPADWRETTDEPAGSLHRITRAIERVAKALG